MTPLVMLLKSYRGDYEYARRLVDSFTAHNSHALNMFVLVPEADVELFDSLVTDHVHVMSEEPLAHYFTNHEVNGIRPGYINQEIVKLAFWELGLAENYFCVDSDAEFVRDFTASDFLAPDGFPYTVLVEDKDLKTDPAYYRDYWSQRERSIATIAECIGFDEAVVRTCHGHQVFNTSVLRSWKEQFLDPRGWSYLDALKVSPYEFSWYSLWLQKMQEIPLHQREPLVKVFHSSHEHISSILSGIDQNDLARAYVAVVINSNYARGIDVAPLSAGKARSLAPYVSYGEWFQVLSAKARSSLRSWTRRAG